MIYRYPSLNAFTVGAIFSYWGLNIDFSIKQGMADAFVNSQIFKNKISGNVVEKK